MSVAEQIASLLEINRFHSPTTGEFTSGGGGSRRGRSAGPVTTAVATTTGTRRTTKVRSSSGAAQRTQAGSYSRVTKLSRIKDQPFDGTPVATSKISKQRLGGIGEHIAVQYLKQHEHQADAKLANTKKPNYPVDATYDHAIVEIKTGDISNAKGSQQWRLTIGEPGKAEKAKIKAMTPAAKKVYNADKAARILERKAKAMKEIEAELGHSVKMRTITQVVDHDRKITHLYSFDGFHPRIGWTAAEAKKAYIGSFHYE